ncbi:MAG TPA: ABC transporter permease [Acidimicrobiia bacterium]|jgi:ABC-type tungstate transport system substrate-binding protein
MGLILEAIADAFASLSDPELLEVVALTLVVSGVASVASLTVGVPIGAALGLGRFRGRSALRVAVDVGMGLPPVLVGLALLLLLWRSGPLGSLRLTFTPTAMIIAQFLLAVPIVVGLTATAIESLPAAAVEQLGALRLSRVDRARLALMEVWPGVVGAAVAAFGRVVSEVGAVLIVGGNIAGETRVLTTLIVQESRQAQFGPALGAGLVLLVISLFVNVSLSRMRGRP